MERLASDGAHTMALQLIPATSAMLPQIYALNQGEVPKVGTLTELELAWYFEHAPFFWVAQWEEAFAGFMVALTPQSDYASPNFRWFCERGADFIYIDRLAVAAAHRRQGLGRGLYEAVQGYARELGARALTCEVNLKPLNQESLDFHRRLGFEQVGEQVDPRNGKSVAMLEKRF